MIYPLVGLILGLVIGGVRAKARGGKRADILQWALAHGMLFGLIGLFVLVFLARAAA